VASTVLVLTKTQLTLLDPQAKMTFLARLVQILHYPIIVIPIVVSVLLVAANRLKPGKKWVLLRGSAEAIKREIYCYRAQADVYSDEQVGQSTREALLAKRIEEISHRLQQTEVNVSALRRVRGPVLPKPDGAPPADDGLGPLTAEQYLKLRVNDQLFYFETKISKLGRRMHLSQWAIYISGGLGTLLAALNVDLWVALTTTINGVLASYIGMNDIENSLIKYNQTATDLLNVRGWWTALTAAEQAERKNVNKLVSYTEKTLEGELVGWVQHMQDALAELREPQKGRDTSFDHPV
jgi:hypothetical protein